MSSKLSPEDQERIHQLTLKILDHYKFNKPPVPVEKVIAAPPGGIQSMDLSDMSLVFGIGEHRYEYRMAMARLVYREICRTGSEGWAGEEFPYNNEAARTFAAYLLVPENWAVKAARRPFISLEKLSESFQVPEYVMASRLAQLGKSVRGM
jgi:hypothetical protein